MTSNLLACSSDIVCAYLSRHPMEREALSDLIREVHTALRGCEAQGATAAGARPAQEPGVAAATIRKSISSDALISFIDGKKYRMLKKHLAAHGLTPEMYREKFGLPADYPMVAANYSGMRSQIARQIGLGVKTRGGS